MIVVFAVLLLAWGLWHFLLFARVGLLALDVSGERSSSLNVSAVTILLAIAGASLLVFGISTWGTLGPKWHQRADLVPTSLMLLAQAAEPMWRPVGLVAALLFVARLGDRLVARSRFRQSCARTAVGTGEDGLPDSTRRVAVIGIIASVLLAAVALMIRAKWG